MIVLASWIQFRIFFPFSLSYVCACDPLTSWEVARHIGMQQLYPYEHLSFSVKICFYFFEHELSARGGGNEDDRLDVCVCVCMRQRVVFLQHFRVSIHTCILCTTPYAHDSRTTEHFLRSHFSRSFVRSPMEKSDTIYFYRHIASV